MFRDLYFSVGQEKGENCGASMKPAKREHFSNRSHQSYCLLCSEKISSSSSDDEGEDGTTKKKKRARLVDVGIDVVGGQNCSLLVEQVEQMFILLRLLDVPKRWCQRMILKRCKKVSEEDGTTGQREGGPLGDDEPWFDVCYECIEKNVAKAWDIHQNIVALQRKMASVKEMIKEGMRKGIEDYLKGKSEEDVEHTFDYTIKRIVCPDLFPGSTLSSFGDEEYDFLDEDDNSGIPVSFCDQDIKLDLDAEDFLAIPSVKGEKMELRSSRQESSECAPDLFVKCELEETGDDVTVTNIPLEDAAIRSDSSDRDPDYEGDFNDVEYRHSKTKRRKKIKSIKKMTYHKWKMCRLCESRFNTFDEYDIHQRAHKEVDLQGEFICAQCTFPARTSHELRSHQRLHHKRGSTVEKRNIENVSSFGKRKRRKGYDCPKCPLRTETWKHLKQHVDHQHPTLTEEELEEAGLILKCNLCEGKQFNSLLNLINHRRKVHSEPKKYKKKVRRKPKLSSSLKKAGYLRWKICRECDTRCKSQEEYDAHRKAHEEPGQFACVQCTFPAQSKKELASHMKSRHEGPLKPRPEKKCYDCPKCPLRTEKWKHLKEHVSQEHSFITEEELEAAGLILKCHLCGGKEFENIQRLTTHKRKVHPELEAADEGGDLQPIVCPDCGLKFASKKLLENHDRSTHKRQAKFVCDECGIGFPWQSALDDHKISHLDRSQKKQVVCDLCGIDFVYKHQLKKHNARCHPKPDSRSTSSASNFFTPPGEVFKCRYCTLTSPIALVIKRHLETHKEELGHRCDQCGKCYTSAQGLSRHVRINHSNESWPCPHCAKKFPCEEYMKDHVKRYCQLRRLEAVEQGNKTANLSFPASNQIGNDTISDTSIAPPPPPSSSEHFLKY